MVEEDLLGTLTLEGPLLEMTYAALCLNMGEKVVPRYETMGVFHDILIKQEDGYVIGECLGQPLVSAEKLSLFKDQIGKLNERLKASGDHPITEARIISLSTVSEWPEETRETLLRLEEHLKSESIELKFVEPKRILYDVIANTILGFSLYDNKIFLVGPNEWAIRYNPAVSKYRFGGSSIDFHEFRSLPHSFMPRTYWSETHRKIFEEYATISLEPIPEWFSWTTPENLGISWRSVEQIKSAIIHSYVNENRDLIYEGRSGFITRRNLKKNPYYTVNLIYHKQMIDGNDAISIEKETKELIETAKKEGKIKDDLDFFNRMFTDTVTFEYSYWAKSKYRTNHGKISYTEINRGEELLMAALNSGTLGLKLKGGKIMFSTEESPNTLKIVNGGLHWESELRGVYPAKLSF